MLSSQATLGSPVLSDQAFAKIRQFFFRRSGIDLTESKRHLVAGRLRSRVLALGLDCYEAYFELIQRPDQSAERQRLIDSLTTNETYFFREPKHFEFLTQQILPQYQSRAIRIWCAAASTGEEPYSLAMQLAETRGLQGWSLLGTDISQRTLSCAAAGLYPLQRLELMPPALLRNWCLRGTGEYEGRFLVRRELRERIEWQSHNLLESAVHLGQFDVIFLRNVLIYFSQATKQRVLDQVVAQLKPGGWLIIGHAESLHGLNTPLKTVRPSIFRRLSD